MVMYTHGITGKNYIMARLILSIFILSVLAASCSRSVTPAQAASGKYKNCPSVR